MTDLADRLIRTNSLPSPPGVALEIIRLNQDDEIDISQLASVISRDPAIAAKLLRTANSSHMGRPGQVADIEDAIMVLGIRAVNLLALSFSLSTGLSSTQSQSFDYAHFWTRSAVTTIAAREISTIHIKAQAEEAFLAGLLCDFGQLLMAEAMPREYAPVLERQRAGNQPIEVVEATTLGCDHAELGARVLREWGLPDLITEAIAAHHDPSRLDGRARDSMRLARVLHLASACASLYTSDSSAEADEVLSLAESYFQLSPADCQELIDGLCEGVPELLEILDLENVDQAEIARIGDQASELLVGESLQLAQRVQAMSNTLERLAEQNVKLERRALTDPLTGLHNRAYLEETMEQELKRAARSKSSVGLLIIDIDRFKSVNDLHGHLAGDTVLRALASLIESRLGFGQSAIRCGGDEFIVFCKDTSFEDLLGRAQLLRQAVEDFSIAWEDFEIRTTLSIGGSVLQGSHASDAPIALLRSADGQLYKAKKKGRNRVFVTSMSEEDV